MGHHRHKAGLPPGSPVFTGQRRVERPVLLRIRYNPEQLAEDRWEGELPPAEPQAEGDIWWYDLRGLHEPALVKELGSRFGMHSLWIEDVLHVEQRPKVETDATGIFIVMQALSFSKETRTLEKEQVALFVTQQHVLSFQEGLTDLLAIIRQRLQVEHSRIRKAGPAYLAYAIMDCIVDHYFLVLEQLKDGIEQIEGEIINSLSLDAKKKEIYQMKCLLLDVRRIAGPTREAVANLRRSEHPLVPKKLDPFLRDLHDHLTHIMDHIELSQEVANSLYDLYAAELNLQMNRTVQILTIFSALFIPLTFIAGVYGMNFRYMPELEWRYGYFAVLTVMAIIAFFMLRYFRRKGWL